MIGYAFCGSFCTFERSISELEKLIRNGSEVLPIMSETAYSTDTRFGSASSFIQRIEIMCGNKIIHTINDAEPVGPKIKLEAMVISPCTGNTLAKLANCITDTAVTMAVKAHLRNDRPLVIAIASNDALSSNLGNISIMLSKKHVYFVPFSQDDCVNKPHSLVCDFTLLQQTLDKAIENKQLQPLFIEKTEKKE